MCVYLYIQNNYTQHKLLFWMQLIAINLCTALNKLHDNNNIKIKKQCTKIYFYSIQIKQMQTNLRLLSNYMYIAKHNRTHPC